MEKDETQAVAGEAPADAERDAAAEEERAYEESLAAACMQVDERQVFYKTLRLVRTTHDDTELREAIAAFPEMACSVKTPRFFLERMRDTGALAVEEPEVEKPSDAGQAAEGADADAGSEAPDASESAAPADAEQPAGDAPAEASGADEPAEAEQLAEASGADEPTEASDAAEPTAQPHHASEHATWTLTPAGIRVLDQLSATKRLARLYAKDEELAPAFDCILEFCREPRKRTEVEAELRAQGFLNVPGIETSFYVDRLEREGGLVWDGGWLTTEDGLAFLE